MCRAVTRSYEHYGRSYGRSYAKLRPLSPFGRRICKDLCPIGRSYGRSYEVTAEVTAEVTEFRSYGRSYGHFHTVGQCSVGGSPNLRTIQFIN